MNDQPQGRTMNHFAPPLRKRKPLLDGQRMALPRAPADEHRVHADAEKVRGLLFNNGEIESAILMKWRVGRGNQAVQLCSHQCCS
jgi:hypothetical protein